MTFTQQLIQLGMVKQILADCELSLNRSAEILAEHQADIDNEATDG